MPRAVPPAHAPPLCLRAPDGSHGLRTGRAGDRGLAPRGAPRPREAARPCRHRSGGHESARHAAGGGERLGCSVRAVKGPYEELPGVPLPAIAHVRTDEGLGHFVVLHRVRPRGVVVADPARGVEKLSRETFSARWTGYLLLLSPRVELRAAAGAPASPPRPPPPPLLPHP